MRGCNVDFLHTRRLRIRRGIQVPLGPLSLTISQIERCVRTSNLPPRLRLSSKSGHLPLPRLPIPAVNMYEDASIPAAPPTSREGQVLR
jgi:hypothetical protein